MARKTEWGHFGRYILGFCCKKLMLGRKEKVWEPFKNKVDKDRPDSGLEHLLLDEIVHRH
jgi:hypothetical protein